MTFVLSNANCACDYYLCQGRTEQNNKTWVKALLTIREYQNFLEGELVGGGASVACLVSHG